MFPKFINVEQLIQSAYGYADIEILPVFKISEDADITERIVTPAPLGFFLSKIKTQDLSALYFKCQPENPTQ